MAVTSVAAPPHSYIDEFIIFNLLDCAVGACVELCLKEQAEVWQSALVQVWLHFHPYLPAVLAVEKMEWDMCLHVSFSDQSCTLRPHPCYDVVDEARASPYDDECNRIMVFVGDYRISHLTMS